jgi:hypothetical protein
MLPLNAGVDFVQTDTVVLGHRFAMSVNHMTVEIVDNSKTITADCRQGVE